MAQVRAPDDRLVTVVGVFGADLVMTAIRVENASVTFDAVLLLVNNGHVETFTVGPGAAGELDQATIRGMFGADLVAREFDFGLAAGI